MNFLKTNMKYLVGAVLLLNTSFLGVSLVFFEIPHGNENVVHLLVGEFLALTGTVVMYFYSTSQGSTHKDEVIKDMLKNKVDGKP